MTQAAAATAPTSTANTSFVADLGRLVRVLFSPGAVFGEMQEAPSFWKPWIIVSVIYAVLNYLQRPFQLRVQQIIMEQRGITVPPQTMVKAIAASAFTPVSVLVICAISAAILYGLVSAFGGDTTFKKMLCVVIFAWPIVLLQQIVTTVVLNVRGVQSIQGPWDAFVSLGADVLLPADAGLNPFMKIVLAGIGPLQIWGLVIVAVGAMVLGKMSKGASWVAATIHYAIGLCVGAGIAAFGIKMMGGR